MKFIFRITILLVAMLNLCGNIFAQSTEYQHLCGFQTIHKIDNKIYLENTKKINPDYYTKLVQFAKSKRKSTEFKIADELNFNVLNQITQSYNQVPATLKYEGNGIRIWVENKEITRINATTMTNNINQIAEALQNKTSAKSRNPNKGIIANDEEVFGIAPTKYKFNNKTDFLLTDIKQPNGNGVILGYFSKNDQSDDIGSNKLNILYIDSKEGFSSGITSLLNTVAHEYQHLIHFGNNPESEISINEGCSEVASILCGYANRGNSTYFKSLNCELFRWTFENNNDLIVDYERMMTFVQYLYEQVGELGLTSLVKIRDFGKDRVDLALRGSNSNLNFNKIFENYSLALYLQNHSNPQYAFKQKLTATSAPKPSQITYSGTNYPATNSVIIQPNGLQYYTYNNPKGLKLKFASGTDVAINAILFRGADVAEIRKLKPNRDECLVDRAYFDKIVIVVCNLEAAEVTVQWSAGECIAGVEDELSELKTDIILQDDNIMLNIVSQKNDVVNCTVYDALGIKKINLNETYNIVAGFNTFSIKTNNLSSGLYFLELKNRNGRLIRKFINKR